MKILLLLMGLRTKDTASQKSKYLKIPTVSLSHSALLLNAGEKQATQFSRTCPLLL